MNRRYPTAFAFVLVFVLLAAPLVAQEEGVDAERVTATRLQAYYGKQDPFARPKASKRHDHVYIVINLSTQARLEGTSQMEKESSLVSELTKWFTPKIDRGGNLVANVRDGPQKPDVEFTASSSHEGDGEIESTQEFKDRVTATVVEVLPNRHLVVSARKRVMVGEEEREIVLMGTVDPARLDADSQVSAEYIADLRVKDTGRGAITDATKRGWFRRFVDKISPF